MQVLYSHEAISVLAQLNGKRCFAIFVTSPSKFSRPFVYLSLVPFSLPLPRTGTQVDIATPVVFVRLMSTGTGDTMRTQMTNLGSS